MHLGFLEVFDHAQNAFISAYRKTKKDYSFEIMVEYMASPSLNGVDLIICDPMLATGRSMVLCYEALRKKGTPRSVHLVSLIASEEGVDYVKQHLDQNIHLWVGAIDEELNAKAYIVPGLGDAGDLAFGEKE
jgi:uracil phosphoribosyltransferase